MKKRFFWLFIILVILTQNANAQNKPVIGISASIKNSVVSLDLDYAKCIEEAGGIPLILPPTSNPEIIKSYVQILDGLMMTGGPDLPPSLYNQKEHPSTKVMEKIRSVSDKELIRCWLRTKKPILGICLGMEFSNVMSGGTLFQDIPTMIGNDVCHRNGEKFTNFHNIGISHGSLLHKILGTTKAVVLSRHHQAVDKIGANLKAIARTSDGVVEALQKTDSDFGLFLQWHPEGMSKYPEHQQRIFKAFVDACKK